MATILNYILTLLPLLGELGYNVTYQITQLVDQVPVEGIKLSLQGREAFTIIIGTTVITITGITYSSFAALLSYSLGFGTILTIATGAVLSPYFIGLTSFLFLGENAHHYTRVYDPSTQPRRALIDNNTGEPVVDSTGEQLIDPNNHLSQAQETLDQNINPAFLPEEDMGSNSDAE